jgi:hypothetical protein
MLCAPATCTSRLCESVSKADTMETTDWVTHPSNTLPINVRGTAPENTTWSYWMALSSAPHAAARSTHFLNSLGPDAVHQDIMYGMNPKALLDFSVRRQKDMEVRDGEQERVEGKRCGRHRSGTATLVSCPRRRRRPSPCPRRGPTLATFYYFESLRESTSRPNGPPSLQAAKFAYHDQGPAHATERHHLWTH